MKTWLKIGSDFVNVEEIEAVQEELESDEDEGKGEHPVIYLYMKSGVRLTYQYDEPEAMTHLWNAISEAIDMDGTVIDVFGEATDEESPEPAGA